MTKLSDGEVSRQEFRTALEVLSPLEFLIADLRAFRDGRIEKDRHRRSAILAGQLALLACEYQRGRRPSRKTLKRFFHFVAREQAI